MKVFSEQNGAHQLLFRSTSLNREYFPAARNPILLVDWLSGFSREYSGPWCFHSFLMQSSPLRSLIAWSFGYYNQVIASYSSFKMPRVTRSSQKQIDFPCRKTRSQQKEIEGAIETSQSNPTRACSVSPRKRHDPVKGKLKTFTLLYSTSIQPQIWKRVLTNVPMPNTTLLLKNFLTGNLHTAAILKSHGVHEISIFPAQHIQYSLGKYLRSLLAIFFYNSEFINRFWSEISASTRLVIRLIGSFICKHQVSRHKSFDRSL